MAGFAHRRGGHGRGGLPPRKILHGGAVASNSLRSPTPWSKLGGRRKRCSAAASSEEAGDQLGPTSTGSMRSSTRTPWLAVGQMQSSLSQRASSRPKKQGPPRGWRRRRSTPSPTLAPSRRRRSSLASSTKPSSFLRLDLCLSMYLIGSRVTKEKRDAIGVDEKAMEISREKTRGGKIHHLYWDSDSNDGSPLDTSHANEVAEEVPVIYQLTYHPIG
ncbi:hypothetical protein VPH35_065729 [Triticum aestivum]